MNRVFEGRIRLNTVPPVEKDVRIEGVNDQQAAKKVIEAQYGHAFGRWLSTPRIVYEKSKR